MPAGLMLRSRVKFGFARPNTVLQLTRSELAKSGPVVAKVVARSVEPETGSYAGIVVRLDGPAPQDETPVDDPKTNPLSSGKPVFNFYTVEVVQRIGYDSFTPDQGVLIAKNKDKESDSCGYGCFTWVIDAHPEDIRMLDFKRPNGEPVMRSIADYRQLNDALFHAGVNSGSQYEWGDTPNRLHFYVIGVQKDDRGILSYEIGVRSLDGTAAEKRGVTIAPGVRSSEGSYQKCSFAVTNTGISKSAFDIFRLSVVADKPDWAAQLQSALVAVKAGSSTPVDVYVSHGGSSGQAAIKLTAQSESDPNQAASATCTVGD